MSRMQGHPRWMPLQAHQQFIPIKKILNFLFFVFFVLNCTEIYLPTKKGTHDPRRPRAVKRKILSGF